MSAGLDVSSLQRLGRGVLLGCLLAILISILTSDYNSLVEKTVNSPFVFCPPINLGFFMFSLITII